MRKFALYACVAVWCVAWAMPANAQSAEQAIAGIRTYEFGQSREPLTVVEGIVARAAQDPGQKRVVARLLADLLHTDATHDAKLFACRQLAIIGGQHEVGRITPLLHDPETADMARYALEPMPGAAVDNALLAALRTAPAETHVGIVTSLGERRVAAAVLPLSRLAQSEDDVMARAALAALGRIGTPRAVGRLAFVKGRVHPDLRKAVSEAQLAAAEQLALEGRTRHAQNIYRALLAPQEPDMVRTGAFFGLARIEGEAATLERIQQFLASPREDAALRQASRHYLNEVARHYQDLAARL